MNYIKLSKKYLEIANEDLAQKDIEILQDIISYHSDLYYNDDSPIISDYEYDIIFKKLEYLEQKYDSDFKQSLNVGSNATSSFAKVAHSRPMISLDNTYNEKDLEDFDIRVKRILKYELDASINYTLEFKFDGLGIALIYKNGRLIQALTRGDGVVGEDVTENVKTISNIPHTIDYKEDIEIRGEVIMPISEFDRLNNELIKDKQKTFSNPRNGASGSLRLLDTSITKSRNLKFFAYSLGEYVDFLENLHIRDYFDVIKNIEKLGFEVSSYFKNCRDIGEIIDYIDRFGNLRDILDFEIDGLVIKVNDTSLWEQIGFTAHHPRYQIAYKFPALVLTTKILEVINQVGRTGTITPVANLQTINIGGANISRATLHNFDEIEKLGVMIGDSVFIKRAGEVIPKIISVITKTRDGSEKPIITPTHCPSCNTLLEKDSDKVRLYCPNIKHCPDQITFKLLNSVSKNGLNIDGLGREQIKLFLKLGLIIDIASIYELEDKKEIILSLEGYKQKSVDNLISAINNSKVQDLGNFLVALNIPNIGKTTAKDLSKIFKSNDDLIDFKYKIEELESIPDVGSETAKNIYSFFTDKDNIEDIENILKYIKINFNQEEIYVDTKYLGLKIGITGSFEGWSRDDIIKKLEDMGGKFVSSLSKNTNILIAGERAGSKLQKARELGIQIISLQEFLN